MKVERSIRKHLGHAGLNARVGAIAVDAAQKKYSPQPPGLLILALTIEQEVRRGIKDEG